MSTHALAPAILSGAPHAAPPASALDLPRPRSRGLVLLGLSAMALFFGGFGTWSALAPLAEAAIAPGTINAEGQRRTVYPWCFSFVLACRASPPRGSGRPPRGAGRCRPREGRCRRGV